MQQITNDYIRASSDVLSDNEALAALPVGFKQIFDKSIVMGHKEKLREHFEALKELDEQYSQFLIAHGSINDLLMRNAAVQIMTQARNMVVGSVKNYESSIVEYEGQLKFRLNITIALIAIVVSVAGLVA